MPPVLVTALGVAFMLALLVGIQLLVGKVVMRTLGPSWRLLSATAGAMAGYFACALFYLVAMLGMGRQEATLRIKVLASSPAQHAGLRDGDRVIFVNGIHPASWDELRALVEDGAGGPIEVEVTRGEETLRLDVQPRDGKIGVMSVIERHDLPLGFAVANAVFAPQDGMVRGLGGMLARMSARRTLMGPVAVVAPDPSPWPKVLRLGQLGSFAWPLAMFLCFARSLRGR